MIRRIVSFFKMQLWYTVSLTFGAVIICMAVCYQQFMHHKYADFLLEKNHLMESAVLETMQKNLDYSLDKYIDLGAQLAVDPDIYHKAEQIFYGSGDEGARNIRDLRNHLIMTAGFSGNVLNMALVSAGGRVSQYDRLQRGDSMMWSEPDTAWLAAAYQQLHQQVNGLEIPRYLVRVDPAVHPTSGERVFHVCFPVIGQNKGFSKMNSMLSITYKMDILQPFLETIADSGASYSQGYITDESGIIIYHSEAEHIGRTEAEYLSSSSFIMLDKKLRRMGWTLHIALDKEELYRNVGGVLSQGMAVYCLLLAVLAVVFYWLMRRITNPLNKIRTAMDQTGNEGQRQKVVIEGSHQIWMLAEGYNEMIEKLAQQEREVEKNHRLALISIERQHQAEWEAMETQINAHFLCNTLGTINYEAMECGNFKVAQLIKKLSNILRYTFDQKCQRVYMYQELAWIEQYLYLQKARLEEVFEYDIFFPEEFANWPCCKLMLQPFVENAIIHGFEGRESGGMLSLKADRCAGFLKISIADNGCGIEPEACRMIQEMLEGELPEHPEQFGIGIRNAASRMRMFYQGKIRISIKSTLGSGTEFTFMVPLLPEKKSRMGGGWL